MSRLFLILGSIGVLLLAAFFGGVKLGQSEMYERLAFGNRGNEILVKVSYGDSDILIKRYRDGNIISIENSEIGLDEEAMRSQIGSKLKRVEGLDNYSWKSNELTLVKVDTAQWEEIIKEIFNAIFSQK